MSRRAKLKSELVGQRPHRMRLFERTPGGPLWCEYWDRATQRQRRVALGHRDWEHARRWARRETGLLHDGLAEAVVRDAVTVEHVLSAYLEVRTPTKVPSEQAADRRRHALFRTLWGSRLVRSLGEREFRAFERDRFAGYVDARGQMPDVPVPVRAATVRADLVFINTVFNWAMQTVQGGRSLIDRNPFGLSVPGSRRHLALPKEREPRRPHVFEEWCDAVAAVAGQVQSRVGGKYVATPLEVLLVLARQTGRRITALCRLRTSDLVWGEREGGGRTVVRIQWRPLKGSMATVVPCTAEVGDALASWVRGRALLGDQWLFEAPRSPGRPVHKRLATEWLYRAIALAHVEKPQGGGWHMFRRKYATERKHLPWKDLGEVAGWTDRRSLENSYIQVDAATIDAVVNSPNRLRGVK